MRTSTFSLITAAATLVAADAETVQPQPSLLQYSEATTTGTGVFGEHGATTTIENLSAPSDNSSGMSWREYDALPHALKQFIIDLSPRQQLVERQNAPVGGGGAAAASPAPTQLSSVTVYDIGEGPVTYTQTFPATPLQFPAPSSGSIGMGSIQGTPGKIRTYTSNPAAAPTVDARVMLAVAGGIGAGYIL